MGFGSPLRQKQGRGLISHQQDEMLHGNTRVSRSSWLEAARDTLIQQGVGEVKILALAHQLNVARSSFYGYFKDRQALLQALLEEWELRNTACIATKCGLPSASINEALCFFFECFVDPRLFDQRLDFAVREWARRDADVHHKVDMADRARLAAVESMFLKHGYSAADADVRARILYFMQLGYYALDVSESLEERLSRIRGYLIGFTGQEPTQTEIDAFLKRAHDISAP